MRNKYILLQSFQALLKNNKSDLNQFIVMMEQLYALCCWFVEIHLEGDELDCFHKTIGALNLMDMVDNLDSSFWEIIDNEIAQQVQGILVEYQNDCKTLIELVATIDKFCKMGKWYQGAIAPTTCGGDTDTHNEELVSQDRNDCEVINDTAKEGYVMSEEDDDKWIDKILGEQDDYSYLGRIGSQQCKDRIANKCRNFNAAVDKDIGENNHKDSKHIIHNFFQRNNRRLKNDMKKHYHIQPDGTVDVDGDVILYKKDFVDWKLPIKFGVVNGNFYCKDLDLDIFSMEGFPHTVNGNFDCSGSIIKNYSNGPKNIKGDFIGIDAVLPEYFYMGKWSTSPELPSIGGDIVLEQEPTQYKCHTRGRKSNKFYQMQKELWPKLVKKELDALQVEYTINT